MSVTIIPHLWFDREAREAAEFYVSVFPDSKVTGVTRLRDTPSGDCDVVRFELAGQKFMAISAGPFFTFNPSVSFILNFDPSKDRRAPENLDTLWKSLSQDGKVLMPLDKYPFSERYGWIEDRYGLSWQLILTNPEGEERPFIIPSLMFAGAEYGKAQEASDFYLSVFGRSQRGRMVHYPAGMDPHREGTVSSATSGSKINGLPPWTARVNTVFLQRSDLLPGAMRHPGRDRPLLDEAFGGPRCRTVRLAQGQVRSLVADRSGRNG